MAHHCFRSFLSFENPYSINLDIQFHHMRHVLKGYPDPTHCSKNTTQANTYCPVLKYVGFSLRRYQDDNFVF